MFTPVQVGCVVHRCQNKNSRLELGTREANDIMPGSAEDFGDLKKVS